MKRDLSTLVDAERLQRISRLTAACFALTMLGVWVMSTGNLAADGKPVGADFVTFWSAGRLALEGNAAAAFDAQQIMAMQRVAVPGNIHLFLWHYPPTFQLMTLPFAALPYLAAYYLFALAGLALFVAALRPLVPWREAGVLLLAMPGTFICLLHGQNSLVTASLLATAIMAIDRRPMLAGVCIGLLAYKPQFGVLFPLVLAITGRWRVMGWAAATVAVFVGASVLVFGAELWVTFFGNLGVAREVVETGQLPWRKIPSAFVFLSKLGMPQGVAYAGQAVVAGAAVVMTSLVWWRRGPGLMPGAVLVAGTMLLTPYTFDYEMAIMAVPLAIIARHLVRHGASMHELVLLVVLAASPIAMGGLVDGTGLQVGFLALAATFAWSVRLGLAAEVPRVIPAVTAAPILGSVR